MLAAAASPPPSGVDCSLHYVDVASDDICRQFFIEMNKCDNDVYSFFAVDCNRTCSGCFTSSPTMATEPSAAPATTQPSAAPATSPPTYSPVYSPVNCSEELVDDPPSDRPDLCEFILRENKCHERQLDDNVTVWAYYRSGRCARTCSECTDAPTQQPTAPSSSPSNAPTTSPATSDPTPAPTTSPATSDPTPAPTSTLAPSTSALQDTPASKPAPLPAGAIAGIAVGGTAGLGCMYLLIRRCPCVCCHTTNAGKQTQINLLV